MSYMVHYSIFHQPIGNWDVGTVTNINGLFQGDRTEHKTYSNLDINSWNMSNVTNMY